MERIIENGFGVLDTAEEAGLTQEQLAAKLNTKISAISRIENHAEDIKLSTLERFTNVLGKKLRLEVS